MQFKKKKKKSPCSGSQELSPSCVNSVILDEGPTHSRAQLPGLTFWRDGGWALSSSRLSLTTWAPAGGGGSPGILTRSSSAPQAPRTFAPKLPGAGRD